MTVDVREELADVDVRWFGAQGSGDETTQVRAALTYCKTNRKSLRFRDGVTYTVDSLSLDYSADSLSTTQGFRPPALKGGGPRSTVIQQKAGATNPLISVLGGDSGNSHDGKVTGVAIGNLELRGTGAASGGGGRGSGGAAPGIKLGIFEFAVLENLYVSRFTDGIQLDRPTKSDVRDDMSQTLEIRSVKTFQNSGAGIRCVAANSIGSVDLHNVESSYNGGIGFDMVPASMVLTACSALANGDFGYKFLVPSNTTYSGAQGPTLLGCRSEGNNGVAEIEIDGCPGAILLGCTVLASAATGPHCVRLGNTTTTRNPVILGGIFSGAGSGPGVVGQKAFVVGANVLGGYIGPVDIELTHFADANSGNRIDAITNNGNGTGYMPAGTDFFNQWRSFAPSTFSAFESRVVNDTNRRFNQRIDGLHEWGSGSATADTNLYRNAADELKTDDKFVIGTGVGVLRLDPIALPATCAIGELCVDTADKKLKLCTAANTWTIVGAQS